MAYFFEYNFHLKRINVFKLRCNEHRSDANNMQMRYLYNPLGVFEKPVKETD